MKLMSNLYVCNYTFRACVSLSLWILMSILHIQTYVESYLRMGVLLLYYCPTTPFNPYGCPTWLKIPVVKPVKISRRTGVSTFCVSTLCISVGIIE